MRDEKFSMTKRCFRRSIKYGYFVPLQALYLCFKKQGGFVLHCRAIYRLGHWNKYLD